MKKRAAPAPPVGDIMPETAGEWLSTLLKHADPAMYTAKAHGGDSYRLFENDMRPGSDRLLLEIYYQPRSTIQGHLVSAAMPVSETFSLLRSLLEVCLGCEALSR